MITPPKPPASQNLPYIAALARGYTETCVNVLVDILTNVDAPRATRIKAAKVLSNYIRVPEVQRLIRVHALRFPQLDAMLRGDL
jgi:hypothetical protein